MGEAGKTVALIVAAGAGARVGGEVPKQYRRIAGKSVLRRSIEPFLHHPQINAIRVVIGEGQKALALDALDGLDVGEFVTGGPERGISVFRGLEAVPPGTERVLIHDAARPFCPPAVIARLLEALERYEGAVPVLRTPDTLAKARRDGTLGEAVDRNAVVRIQTPQAFLLKTLLHAIEDWRATSPTDESAFLRAKQIPVALVDGDPLLEKLTFEGDFAAAEARLAVRLTSRTGLGFDVHAFAPGEELWLGGIRIPSELGLKGHSDADVLLHALTDALLGAVGAGDIGDHFPPSDPQWRGAASSLFIEHARAMIEALGGRIDHVDVTLICEAPRLAPHRDSMRASVAALLRLPPERVSIKATTTERLGFTGRGEGMAAQAVATIRLPEEVS
ncbi:MAG TPA: bifunctional 2-C-methyl-D-erythritol 4-phosphate cytidylyltransferase/2-C-methyl-D-erythritol 2,4-cyclodiphosphate synthase [Allosphingosinicella sp.]|jgi:2-C-methyl-D-erythritol 4-phosphate cytidylyltransferase/2-C-methyl-D-erythritol 2,4-cyclodiphosphate synthase